METRILTCVIFKGQEADHDDDPSQQNEREDGAGAQEHGHAI